MEDIKNIIESLLFVSENPLTIGSIKNVLTIEDPKEIRIALKELADDYEKRDGAVLLHEVAGGFQIRTRPEYNQWVKRLIQPKSSRLSKAALETLAIIAYKQPIIRNDVEHIRGVDCGGVIRILLEKKLVRVLGRKEIPGRPLIYGTTKQFLEVFDLKNLRDLPTPKEIEELRASVAEDADPEPMAEPADATPEQETQIKDDEDKNTRPKDVEPEPPAPEEEPGKEPESQIQPADHLKEEKKEAAQQPNDEDRIEPDKKDD
jgi:segregation and condensation protein B